MRGHFDKIATPRNCCVDDGLVRMFVLNVDCLALNAGSLSSIGSSSENFRRLRFHTLIVLGPNIFNHLHISRKNVKWYSYC